MMVITRCRAAGRCRVTRLRRLEPPCASRTVPAAKAQVLHAASKTFQLRNDDTDHLAAVYQFHEPLQAWPREALGRLAAGHNDVDQFGALHGGHGADLGLLGIERNATLRLPSRRDPPASFVSKPQPLRRSRLAPQRSRQRCAYYS